MSAAVWGSVKPRRPHEMISFGPSFPPAPAPIGHEIMLCFVDYLVCTRRERGMRRKMKSYRVLFGRFLENDHVVLSLPLLSEEQESPSAAKIAGEAIPAIPVCLSNVAMQPARPSPLPPVLEMQLRDVIQARHARHAGYTSRQDVLTTSIMTSCSESSEETLKCEKTKALIKKSLKNP